MDGDLVSIETHRLESDALVRAQEVEISKGDKMHARHCRGLEAALQDAQKSLRAAQEDGIRMEEELQATERRCRRMQRVLQRDQEGRSEHREVEGTVEVDIRRLESAIAAAREEKHAAARTGEAGTQKLTEEVWYREGLNVQRGQLKDDMFLWAAEQRRLERLCVDIESRMNRDKRSFLALQDQRRRDVGFLNDADERLSHTVQLVDQAAQRAFTRGTNITTTRGPCIEDIQAVATSLRRVLLLLE
eukprot:Hpha_TRINITY_DN5106_c0_g1::TRINITY_DN5106_c0_g1_i1::g.193019::m.193019